MPRGGTPEEPTDVTWPGAVGTELRYLADTRIAPERADKFAGPRSFALAETELALPPHGTHRDLCVPALEDFCVIFEASRI